MTEEQKAAVDATWPDGRVVYYEGDDPEGFAAAMLSEYGIDVRVATPYCWCEQGHPQSWGEGTCRPLGGRAFFIPAGLVGAIYGSDRWQLGS